MAIQGEELTLTDIAKLAGVGVSAVSNWRKRHPDFPQPVSESGQELFPAAETARWLSQRKIARNSLHPGEPVGTTYGDRFARNVHADVRSPSLGSLELASRTHQAWASQLRQSTITLRNDLDAVSASDLMMALLYVRTFDQERWHAVVQERSWDAVSEILRAVPPFSELGLPLPGTGNLDIPDDKLTQVIGLINEIDIDETSAGAIFDSLLESVNRDLGKRGGHFTPAPIVKLLVDILGPHENSTLFDPSCGSGEFLAAAAQHVGGSVFGQAMNVRSLQLSLLNLLMHGHPAQVRVGDPGILRGAFVGEQFDFVLSNPPFGITLPDESRQDAWPFGTPGKRDALAWAQIAVDRLKPGGRAAVLMPNGALFIEGASAEIRRNMIEAGAVEGIIALPAGLFAETAIPVSLWLLRKPEPAQSPRKEILFADATSMGTLTDRRQRILSADDVAEIVQQYSFQHRDTVTQDSEKSAELFYPVNIEEIRVNNYNLQPSRYIRETGVKDTISDSTSALAQIDSLRQEMRDLELRTISTRRAVEAALERVRDLAAEDWPTVLLGDLCDVQSGPGAVARRRELLALEGTPLVLPRNIGRGRLIHEELDTVSSSAAGKLERYKLRPHDIVCARSGTLGRHALIETKERGWIIGPSCMRLRVSGSDAAPEYLTQYLNSPDGQSQIKSKSQRSTAIPHISSVAMRELLIPLPPSSVQEEIASMLSLVHSYVEQHQQAVSVVQSWHDLIFPALRNA